MSKIIEMPTLLSVLNRITEGQVATTLLVEVRWEDGSEGRAYMKIFSEELSLGILNEITGYVLAHCSGLPLPKKAGIIQYPNNLLENQAHYFKFAFVCAEVPGKTPNSIYNIPSLATAEHFKPIIELIRKWSYLPQCAAFDDWTANTDRHFGNVIFSHSGEIYLIDHSNLPISPVWKADELKPDKDYVNRITDLIGYADKSALPKPNEILLAARGHNLSYDNAAFELNYWWDIFLRSDKERYDALKLFIRERSQNRYTQWCTKFNMLEV